MADTDRELLELAAKAAGITFGMETDSGPTYHHEAGFYNPDSGRFWNPLTEDDDALRLAVKLRLRVSLYNDAAEVCMNVAGIGWLIRGNVPYAGDPAAATRRAIVRAAAEIGRSTLGGKG